MKKLIFALFLCSVLLSFLPTLVLAEADHSKTVLSSRGFDSDSYMKDESHRSFSKAASSSEIYLENDEGISHLYVIFDKIYGEWELSGSNAGSTVTVGKDSFLHEYIDVKALFGAPQTKLTLKFDAPANISEVYGFTEGELPDWVQIWEKPLDKADILLLSSHSDDEQLFFAGILPYYAGEIGADVQVVYLISHFDVHDRPHEQLDGLWTVGVRNYPIISDFPDLYSESLEGAISVFQNSGVSYSDFEIFIVENLRRFKPQVLVTHDIDGEYGHGTHILCTDVVMKVLPLLSDEDMYPESAEKYGVWDIPKTYLHLYKENAITMDWDKPLSSFDGKTAFEMTVEGFACHKSQHWTWFNDWIHGTSSKPVNKATDITYCSPCEYGLYRTSVGPDLVGGDFLENITLYKDQIPEIPETEPAPETTKAPENTETQQPVTDQGIGGDVDNNENEGSFPILLIVLLFGFTTVIIIVYVLITRKK